MREGNQERGFTLIELMVVVAIVAILAAVIVPTFMKETTRGKAKSEVSPMFAELASREDQYKLESPTSSYLTTATCPPTATRDGTEVLNPAHTCLANWTTMRVQPSTSKLSCAYTVRTGVSATTPLSDANWPSWVTGVTAPATSWYFIVAQCPENEYFTASWDTKIRSKDGK